jgi:deoxyguanosine kinase
LAKKDVMNVAFLGLGGNLGNRLENLNKTIKILQEECGDMLKASSVYETDPWGSDSKKKYLNQVIKIRTSLSATELIGKTLGIEKKLGRKRDGKQYHDRKTDIDILFFNNEVVNLDHIKIPHPRLHLRRFVLIPLNEIEPALKHPVLKKTVKELIKDCTDDLIVTPYMKTKNNTLHYICVEGNIGSGKTTLAKALAKKFNASFLAEEFEQNRLLPLFYKYPGKYAFPLEYSFLIGRFEKLSNFFAEEKKLVISDFSIHKSLWFARETLQKKEYRLFKKHFNAFAEQLPEPDLMIYISTSTNNLKQNIKKRGRDYEQYIDTDYLESINKEYFRGLKKINKRKLMVIPVKIYHKDLTAQLVKSIEKYVKENFGQTI